MTIRSWPYVVGAICAAAIVAGLIVGLEWLAFLCVVAWVESGPLDGSAVHGLFVAAFATPVFLIGLAFPGLPIWLWLHSIGRNSYSIAALAGAVGATVAGVVLTAPAAGWVSLTMLLWLGLPGAASGVVIRLLAYVRPTPRPAPPS